jgi:DNA-binding PadR family transcriptional regulator
MEKVEHLEDKSSRPHKIYYALSDLAQKIIRKVRKIGLFSLDEILISLSPYIERLNRINCWRTSKRYG